MANKNVEKLQEILNRTTDGVWSFGATGLVPRSAGEDYKDSVVNYVNGEYYGEIIHAQDEQGGESWNNDADMELLIAAKNDLPAILEELAKANAALDKIAAIVGEPSHWDNPSSTLEYIGDEIATTGRTDIWKKFG